MIEENFNISVISKILDEICEEFKIRWHFVIGLDERPETVRIRFYNPNKSTNLSYCFDLSDRYGETDQYAYFRDEVRRVLFEWDSGMYREPTDNEFKRNAEHYIDPTAYKAIKKADKDAEHEKVRKLTGCLRRICELAGFSIVGRVELLDESTGKIWK